ncbi:MAG: NAD(P)H-dependent oxidoreductase subunit E [Candidatus Bathyarchaeia archaeon]
MEKNLEVDDILEEYRGKPEYLINALQRVQERIGFLPMDVQRQVAEALGIPQNIVYGVVSFYNLFTMVPKGRHTITVCQGTSCYVRGGKRLLQHLKDMLKTDVGGTTQDRNFSLTIVRCLGACALSPVVMVDKDLYRHVTIAKLPSILSKYSSHEV